jgi:hypothetical protein
MASRGIRRSILSVSTPQGNAFNSEPNPELRRKKTIALVRLLNEYVAEVCRLWPERFSFLGIVPLPWVADAVVEAQYVLEEMGAVGVCVLTNAEGAYVGDEGLEGLWEFLNGRAKEDEGGRRREVVFVHPTEPVIKLEDGRLVNSRPCKFFPLSSSIAHFNIWTCAVVRHCVLTETHKRPCVLDWESFTLKRRVRCRASLRLRLFSNSRIFTGVYRTAQVLFQIFLSGSRHLRPSKESVQGEILVRFCGARVPQADQGIDRRYGGRKQPVRFRYGEYYASYWTC